MMQQNEQKKENAQTRKLKLSLKEIFEDLLFIISSMTPIPFFNKKRVEINKLRKKVFQQSMVNFLDLSIMENVIH